VTPKMARQVALEIGATLVTTPMGDHLFFVPREPPPPPPSWRYIDRDADAPPIEAIQMRLWQQKEGLSAVGMVKLINHHCDRNYGKPEWYGWQSGSRVIPSVVRRKCCHLIPPLPPPADE
jgi:hypothetical protein